jgi:putative transposase
LFGAGLVLDAVPVGDNHSKDLIALSGAMQNVGTGRHVAGDLHVRLVFVTKYRRRVPSALAIKDLGAIFAKVCRDFGAELNCCASVGRKSPSYFASSCGGAGLSGIAEPIRNRREVAPSPRPEGQVMGRGN